MGWNQVSYDVEQACGHTTTIVTNNESEADALMHVRCDKCLAMDKFNSENNLVQLEGTKKQGNWANDLRKAVVEKVQALFDGLAKQNRPINPEITESFELLKQETDASFFIDHRDSNTKEILYAFKLKMDVQKERAEEIAVAEEIVITPEVVESNEPAEIQVQGDLVVMSFKRHAKATEVLKAHGYQWDKEKQHWQKQTAQPTDRAAELGARLLILGVPVILHNPVARDKLLTRTFVKENQKRITAQTFNEQLHYVLNCPNYEELEPILLNALGATKLKAGRYRIGVSRTDDLLEFADEYEFEFDEQAARLRDTQPRRIKIETSTEDLSDLLDD